MSRLVPLALALALLASVAASAATAKWSGVTRVNVATLNGSVPTSKTNPRELSFTTPAQLKRVTRALDANGIARRTGHDNLPACAGGVQLNLTILQHAKRTKLSAYLCGDKTYGTLGGNIKGFMKAVGAKV